MDRCAYKEEVLLYADLIRYFRVVLVLEYWVQFYEIVF